MMTVNLQFAEIWAGRREGFKELGRKGAISGPRAGSEVLTMSKPLNDEGLRGCRCGRLWKVANVCPV